MLAKIERSQDFDREIESRDSRTLASLTGR